MLPSSSCMLWSKYNNIRYIMTYVTCDPLLWRAVWGMFWAHRTHRPLQMSVDPTFTWTILVLVTRLEYIWYSVKPINQTINSLSSLSKQRMMLFTFLNKGCVWLHANVQSKNSDIGKVVLKKKALNNLTWLILLSVYFSLWKRFTLFYILKRKDTLCEVWLKLTLRFLRKFSFVLELGCSNYGLTFTQTPMCTSWVVLAYSRSNVRDGRAPPPPPPPPAFKMGMGVAYGWKKEKRKRK